MMTRIAMVLSALLAVVAARGAEPGSKITAADFAAAGHIYQKTDGYNITYGIARADGTPVTGLDFVSLRGLDNGNYVGRKLEGGSGVADSTGRVVVPFDYEMIIPVDGSGALIVVDRRGRAGMLDAEGNRLVKMNYKSNMVDMMPRCVGGYILFEKAGKRGRDIVVDRNGKTMLSGSDIKGYDRSVSRGTSYAVKHAGHWRLMDASTGKALTGPMADVTVCDVFTIVRNAAGRYGVVATVSGKEIVPCVLKSMPVKNIDGDFVIVNQSGGSAVYDAEGREVAKAPVGYTIEGILRDVDNGAVEYLTVGRGGHTGLAKADGEPVIEARYDRVWRDGRGPVQCLLPGGDADSGIREVFAVPSMKRILVLTPGESGGDAVSGNDAVEAKVKGVSSVDLFNYISIMPADGTPGVVLDAAGDIVLDEVTGIGMNRRDAGAGLALVSRSGYAPGSYSLFDLGRRAEVLRQVVKGANAGRSLPYELIQGDSVMVVKTGVGEMKSYFAGSGRTFTIPIAVWSIKDSQVVANFNTRERRCYWYSLEGDTLCSIPAAVNAATGFSYFNDGRGWAYDNQREGYVLYDIHGHELTECIAMPVAPMDFDGGFSVVTTGRGCGVVDTEGCWAVMPGWDELRNLGGGRFQASRESMTGVIDAAGNVVQPLEKHEISITAEGD